MATINLTGGSSVLDEVVDVVGGLHVGVVFLHRDKEKPLVQCVHSGGNSLVRHKCTQSREK